MLKENNNYNNLYVKYNLNTLNHFNTTEVPIAVNFTLKFEKLTNCSLFFFKYKLYFILLYYKAIFIRNHCCELVTMLKTGPILMNTLRSTERNSGFKSKQVISHSNG